MKKRLFKYCFSLIVIFTLLFCHNKYSVMASWHDTTPPKVGTVKILSQLVYAPGKITIEVSDIVEEDSGIESVYIKLFRKGDNDEDRVSYSKRYLLHFDKKLFTGDKGIASFTIPSDIPSGKYSITSVTVSDESMSSIYNYDNKIDNDHYLLKSISTTNGEYDYCNLFGNCYVYGNEFDEDISAFNPNLPDILENMEDGKLANIYGTTTIPKLAFDAIKGSNKNIMINADEGIKWIFNGHDITKETKDVDCKVYISAVPGQNYGTNSQLMRLDFASNGILPGTAKIKLKSDYLYQLYNIPQDLNLYYINEKERVLSLENSGVEILLDGSDGWCEFDITHNSSFLLSSKKLIYKEPPSTDDTIQKPYVKLNAATLPLQLRKSTSVLKITEKISGDRITSWTSSKPQMVSVNKKNGKLTARKIGTSIITLKMKSGATARCKIIVQKKPVKIKKLKLNKKTVTLKKGRSITLRVTKTPLTASDKVTYQSSKKKVASVSKKGKIKALKKGRSSITIKAGKKSISVKVMVK